MRKWIHIATQFKYFLLFFIALTIIVYESIRIKNDTFIPIEKVQQLIQKEDLSLGIAAKKNLHFFSKTGGIERNEQEIILIYKNQHLVAWNSNKVPLTVGNDTKLLESGISHLSNGWYLGKSIHERGYTCWTGICLLEEYPYSNEYIQSKVHPIFDELHFHISTNEHQGSQVLDGKGNYLFSLDLDHASSQPVPWYILPLIILALISFLYACYEKMKGHIYGRWLFILGVIGLWYGLFQLPKHVLFEHADFYSAELFAYNSWFPNLYSFCINVICIIFGMLAVFKSLYLRNKIFFYYIHFIGVFLVWAFIIELMDMFILHSNIPFDFNQFFKLNYASFVFFSLIGFLFLCFQKIVHDLILLMHDLSLNRVIQFVISILFCAVFSFIPIFQKQLLFVLFVPAMIIGLQLFFYIPNSHFLNRFTFQLILLCVFSFIFIRTLSRNNERIDEENRSIYARKLATERDVDLEIEYSEFSQKLKLDHVFKVLEPFKNSADFISTVPKILEEKYFHGIWDGYEIFIDVANEQGVSFITHDSSTFKELKNLAIRHGEKSEIDPSLYFMPHEENGFSYLVVQEIPVKTNKIWLTISLKSKRIPEEIGFPRLLISQEANVLHGLEKYSSGKYLEGRLIHQSGTFNYPVSIQRFVPKNKFEGSFQSEGYHHSYYRKSHDNVVVISMKAKNWFDEVTSFAYIFCFWGILIIGIYLLTGRALVNGMDFSFAFKIQIAFVLVLVLSLLMYGIGSGVFVGQQYENYTKRTIHEKLSSIQSEIESYVARKNDLSSEQDRSSMEVILKKFARIFHTDLNLFDRKGLLVASSRQKIFDLGLIGEQIDPSAFISLIKGHKSSFSHLEEIGQLSFISSYLPVYNENHDEIAYINLQHFGQQEAYENQIETFVTSIVNIFILLLALSVILGLFVSNWLLSPLNLLKKHMTNIQFGKENKHIIYQQKDEIGAIVKAYNDKLDELELTAKKLALTERESAWRELAQQIAHEIKNPLTPMKLSIQHLLRNYDPLNEEGKKQLNKVMVSIIEQIDGLTRIANEFSHFAKMPEPIFQRENIIDIVDTVLSIYTNEEQHKIKFLHDSPFIFIHADRNLWIQVFVNLLQNAHQALIGIPKGLIQISVSLEEQYVVMTISDNGCGISKEKATQIFTPHFTTKSSGSGIGLALVKQIVEKHGGEISFTSEENVGTTFRIHIPHVS